VPDPVVGAIADNPDNVKAGKTTNCQVLFDGSRIRLSAVLFVVARRRVDGIFADMSRLDNAATAKMANAQTKSGAVRQDLTAC